MSKVEEKPTFTEHDMQNALYYHLWRKNHRYIVPNTTLYGHEADMVSVTGANYVCEYEIKTTRADFLRDRKKAYHRNFVVHRERGANYFYYVVPRGLIKAEELPEYAGWIELPFNGVANVMRQAPRLHKKEMTEHARAWLERALTVRYWTARLKLDNRVMVSGPEFTLKVPVELLVPDGGADEVAPYEELPAVQGSETSFGRISCVGIEGWDDILGAKEN